MEIREFRDGDVLVLAPDGSLAGGEESSALEARLFAALKANTRLIVIDCTSVGQLTSAAVRGLLLTSRKLGRTGGHLVLCGMNAKVKKAFSISGFDKDFTVVGTRGEALQRVLEPAPSSAPKAARPPRSAPARSPAPPDAPVAVPDTPQAPEPSAPSPVERPQAVSAAAASSSDVPVALPAAPAPAASTAASPVPAPDPRDALATVLLEALGVRVARPVAQGAGGLTPADLDALARQVSAALGVRAS